MARNSSRTKLQSPHLVESDALTLVFRDAEEQLALGLVLDDVVAHRLGKRRREGRRAERVLKCREKVHCGSPEHAHRPHEH
eukprot:6197835-Pleurochrysis_carterae.AAC.5